MAKNKHDTGRTITTPSWFGSHQSMVVEDIDDKMVLCKDDYGYYSTYKTDNGLADSMRYSRSKSQE